MKVILVLPFLGLVFAAPLTDENIEKSPIVKRAMETIMFGNQQNSNKQVKKSDPSVPLRDIPDVKAPVLPDNGGTVEAGKAVDLPETKPENSADKDDSTENTDDNSAENGDTSAQNSEEISPENQAAIDELTKSVDDNSKGSSEVQASNDDNLSSGDNYDNYDLFELYKEYQNMLSQRPQYNYYYDTYRRRRRNAKRKRTFKGNLREAVVKRAHRTKRDLTYPDEADLYAPYYYPDTPYMDSDIYGRYGSPFEVEEEPTLEDILAESNMPYQMDEPSLYEYRPFRYEEEEPYVPVKRQSMLSFVPGNRKRSSYFYPANEEPETNFGAFILPSKREYFDTYGSLVRAARLLAAREEERNALQGYDDWYKR